MGYDELIKTSEDIDGIKFLDLETFGVPAVSSSSGCSKQFDLMDALTSPPTRTKPDEDLLVGAVVLHRTRSL